MEHIIHSPEYRVVVCKKCKYAVLPQEIESHFRPDRPHGFTKQVRQAIIERVAQIEGLIQNVRELEAEEFPFPSETTDPIAVLAAPRRSGLRCTFIRGGIECPYICGTKQNIQKHCREEHDWRSRNRGGRPRKSDVPKEVRGVPWRNGVQYQRFFKQGPKSGFFEVFRKHESEETIVPCPKTTWEKLEEKMNKSFAKVEEATRRRIEATDESREPNPWLRRTGWSRHLGGLDQVKMRDLVRPVDDDERELRIIHQAFVRTIKAAKKIAVTNVVGQFALFEANRKDINSPKPKKPFNSRMNKTTFRKYTGVWKQLLSYVWRADDLEENERPAFKLNRQQQVEFDALIDVVDKMVQFKEDTSPAEREKAEQEIEGVVLRLCIAMLDHVLGDNQYESVVVSGLAVLGLDEGGSWFDAEDYTPVLSAVVKLARLMVIFKAYDLRQCTIDQRRSRKIAQITRQQENQVGEESLSRGEIERISQVEAEAEAPTHVELVQKMMRKFMVLIGNDGKPSPMDWILDTRTYGLHIRYHTAAEGTIGWRGETILYQHMQFTMSQVRSMVHGLVAEARRMLFEGLLMLDMDEYGDIRGSQLPPIDWDSTVDNPTEQRIGWSFLKDVRNKFDARIPGRNWLARRVVEKPELRRKFIEEEGDELRWRKTGIKSYQAQMEQFQEKMLVLMHMVGGQAARSTEIISIRHRNTTNGGVRNIFIDEGMVSFVTAYHKGYEMSERTKIIHRFLPREIGELLIYYLWLALPFSEAIEVMEGQVEELSAFIWGDARSPEDEDDIGEEEDDEDLPEEPVRPGENPRRKRKMWTSERMRKIIQRESMDWMGVRINISAWRQVAIAIARKLQMDLTHIEDDSPEGAEDFDEDNTKGDSPWDLQSGHGTRIAGMIYARLMSEGEFETRSQKEQFRKISQEWHRFLGFSPIRNLWAQVGQKRKRYHWEEFNREMQQLRYRHLRQADIQARLESILKPGSQFRGLQKPAINAIIRGESPIVVVMGTGGGKSMLFMLPASITPGGSTVVIVPLVALQGDLQESCEKARLKQ